MVRPFGPFEIEAGGAHFSTGIEPAQADALLCEWAPGDELLEFDGPSAWYTAEPRTNPNIGVLAHEEQRRFLSLLRPPQLLHHAHEDARFRVPHMTHDAMSVLERAGPREAAAVTVVSNYGGPIHNRGPDIRLRNTFATTPGVALFGRRSKWKHYRGSRWSLPRAPATYAGEVPAAEKLDLMSRYHAAVCLENTVEPHYFSEKFVDAARAGCVPIYVAHATVRDTVLQGATWVDPADHDFDPVWTLRHALSLDREHIASRNYEWLRTERVHRTSMTGVWAKIAEALGAAR